MTKKILPFLPFAFSFLTFLFGSFNSYADTSTKTYNAPGGTTSVDGCGDYCNSLTGVSFVAGDFIDCCDVTDVNVTITWAKTAGTCAAPTVAASGHTETSFMLVGPTGTQVVLVPPNLYTGDATMSLVATTFDQSGGAPPAGGTPVAGTFQPGGGGDLTDFDGTNGLGTWTLYAGDNMSPLPLCITSYSVELTLAATLPVELLTFSGRNEGRSNQLIWKTGSEIWSSHFEVERSANGIDFDYLDDVAAIGNSSQVESYDYIDERPLPGVNYYRLKMVDWDGNEAYSEVIEVRTKTQTEIKSFPNPFVSSVSLELDVAQSGTAAFMVFDIRGKQVEHFTRSLDRGLFVEEFDLDQLPQGIYVVKALLPGNTENITTRIVKQ